MKPDRNIARVHRFLQAQSSPQAVLRDRLGRLELVAASSPLAAVSDRVVGVFRPDVSLAVFSRELRA
jgi:hypothetical protein